ncbi:very-long-chain 3-oxoacyl-CoA reductase-like protein At1g24470 [Zingiber officinale]|uniref:very-long-chain 3-oxoacyl-CoA reductase-like protein At1g24470 n=1 Tax=Zingiber officinale TaxID=94328 RepID=UPI001C4C4EC3|nr:very-long-chain 3-oxoacyl-CoA reductase-like protein At1g24470 [Zingiber officinale]
MAMATELLLLLNSLPWWLLLLSSVGFLMLLRAAAALLRHLYRTLLRTPKNLNSYGAWAVVTGASDGIGKAFAAELARRGLHLLLVGRHPAKLADAAFDVAAAAAHPAVKVDCLVLDLADDDLSGFARLQSAVDALDVGVLVNCAGATLPHAMYFHEADEATWRGIVRVNAEAATRVARAVVPGMLRRRRGAVVNVGSAASVVLPSFPFSAVYAATKAYIGQLSSSLQVEYRSMGIDVQCQIPFYVATKMVDIQKPSTFVPSPERYAKAAVDCIGYETRCSPYWSHSLQWWLLGFIPHFLLNRWRLILGEFKRSQAMGHKLYCAS